MDTLLDRIQTVKDLLAQITMVDLPDFFEDPDRTIGDVQDVVMLYMAMRDASNLVQAEVQALLGRLESGL